MGFLTLVSRMAPVPLPGPLSAATRVIVETHPSLQVDSALSSPKLQAANTEPGPISPNALPEMLRACPALVGPEAVFRPTKWLPSGHMQTIFAASADTLELDPVTYTRTTLLVPDGGTLTLDTAEAEPLADAPQRPAEEQDTSPTIVILHGLTGGSHESYVRHVVRYVTTRNPSEGPRYRCVVINFRGCASTPVTSSQLYSAAKTSDVATGLLALRARYPRSPMIGIGYSLGANILSKYLGEWAGTAQLWGAVVCAAPFDTAAGSICLEKGRLAPIYSRAMAKNLSRLASLHADTLALHEPLRAPLRALLGPSDPVVEAEEKKRGVKKGTLRWVDDTLTRHIGGYPAPVAGFPYDHADRYYDAAGAMSVLHSVERPLLALNADDDPIVAPEGVIGLRHAIGLEAKGDAPDSHEHEAGGNKHIVLATTPGGGHLGWWTGVLKPVRWLAKPVAQWFDAIAKAAEARGGGAAPCEPRPTTTRKVSIQLAPTTALPTWDPRPEKEKPSTKVAEEADAQEAGAQGEAPRHAWLLTHILDFVPLLHPKLSPDYVGPPADEKEAAAQGWETFEADMITDTEHPEVGYVVLPPSSRVAGAGSTFRGGIDIPGGKGGFGANGMVKGL